jgi:Tol biopolymer transport system component
VAYDPITFRLFAVNRGLGGGVTLVDVSPNAPAGEIETGPNEAYVVAVNPRTGHIFVVCGDEVKVYDRRDNGLITTQPVGGGSEEGIAVDVIRNLIYVTNSDADTVTVIQDTLTYDVVYTAWQNTGQLVNVDDTGQHERQLTDPDMHYIQPDWRPDGRYIVVGIYSYQTEEYDIYRMESGGQNKINLTSAVPETEDLQPVWSPNGQQIAWRRDWRIWLMEADGSSKQPLTPLSLSARDPKWSPDGQWISFVAWNGDHEDVFIIPAAGGTPINITNHPEVDLNQSWSADSQEMAFESFRDGNWEIYKANISDPENIQLTRLTDIVSNDHTAAWSEDGLTIAFVSDRDDDEFEFSIWLMDTDGSDQRRLTLSRVFLGLMSWSPDSRWLLSRAGYGFESQIYKIDTLTGAAYPLSDTGFSVDSPTWRPDSW